MNSVRNRIYAGIIAFIVIAAFASLLMGGEPQRITSKAGLVELRLPSYQPGVDVTWEARQPLDLDFRTYEGGSVIVFYASQPGQLIVTSDVIDWDKKVRDKTSWIVTIEGKAPDPKPDPKPDDPPKPEPDKVAPIPLPGLRVLMVFESSQGPPEPFLNVDVQQWLTSNCAVSESNTAEWRMIDQNDTFVVGKKSEHWKAAAERPRSSVPWVVISNGTTGYEGAPPATADQFLELLKRFK